MKAINEKDDRLREIGHQIKSLEEEARGLMSEIYREEKEKQMIEREKVTHDKCRCTHERKQHGKSFSINYTDGACKDCKCKYFCMS